MLRDAICAAILGLLITAFFFPEFALGLASFLTAHAEGFRRCSAAYREGWRSVRVKKLRAEIMSMKRGKVATM
jgi:hypothetical protein